MKQSYEEYRFSVTEILKYLVQGLLLCGAVDYLFYQNPWLMFLALPVTVFFLKWKKKGLIRERKKNLNYSIDQNLRFKRISLFIPDLFLAPSWILLRLRPILTDVSGKLVQVIQPSQIIGHSRHTPRLGANTEILSINSRHNTGCDEKTSARVAPYARQIRRMVSSTRPTSAPQQRSCSPIVIA